jgi:hypothetical protein
LQADRAQRWLLRNSFFFRRQRHSDEPISEQARVALRVCTSVLQLGVSLSWGAAAQDREKWRMLAACLLGYRWRLSL